MDDPVEQYTLTVTDQGFEKKKGHVPKQRKKDSSWYYFGVAGQIGLSIALPIVAGALAGKFADNRFSLGTKGTATGLIIGAVISFIGFVRTVKQLLRGMQ